MLKAFDFECLLCGCEFSDIVEGIAGKPDLCAGCGATGGFKKLLSAPNIPTNIVVDYPGSKRFKAGYVHTHGDRSAERKGSQVSMYNPNKKR